MGAIVVVLLVALVLAAVVMLYAAYPYRGEDTPLTPMLGRAMRRGVDSLPTLDPESGPERPVWINRSMVDAQADGHR
jgi:hypothetical protein